MNPQKVKEYFAFMRERQKIYNKKVEGLPKPWTDDKILQEYRFCNVYREQDTVTEWVHENIRVPYADHPNLWFMLAIARLINWPPTLQALMNGGAWPLKTWKPEKARAIMLDLQESGAKVYTGAYMLNCVPKPGQPSDKPYYTCHTVLDEFWKEGKAYKKIPITRSLEETWVFLTGFEGIGAFIAYEIVTDLRHTRYLFDAPDIMTWANPGPGAKRGINRICDMELNARFGDDYFIACMRMLLDYNSQDGGAWPYAPLEMRDIEHCLCEFDKYERVRLGEGRPRSKYNGKGE